MNTKYKKSSRCIFCSNEIKQSKRDGKFLCSDCLNNYNNKILDLLKENSMYKDKIQRVQGYTSSYYGTSNKTTVITIQIKNNKYSHVYVKIPTHKLLEIMELNNDALVEYIDAEIHIQYICMINKYKEQAEQKLNGLLNSDIFKEKCLQHGISLEEGSEKVRKQMLGLYENENHN